MSETIFAVWGDTTGRTRCCYFADGTNCDKPAVRDVIFDDNSCAGTCAEHLVFINQNQPPKDTHPFGPNCGMPGTHWLYSRGGEEGYCFVPEEGVEVVRHEAKELVGTGT